MKRNIALLTALVSLFFLVSCGNAPAEQGDSQQPDANAEQIAKDWDAAKEAYHDVMSSTFHPAEEGDVEPLKARYTELASEAKKWAALPLPEDLKGKGMEELLNKLVEGSEAIAPVVAEGTDEDLVNTITALHDVFHEIVGLCDH